MESLAPFEIVIFGGSGDLAMRKLLPALYRRHRAGQLPADGRLVGTARSALSREEFIARAEESCRRYVAAEDFSPEDWRGFAERLDYACVDALGLGAYETLAEMLDAAGGRTRVFYLAVAPQLFVGICRNLAGAGLVTPSTRVVLEKPLGRDLASAREISEQIGEIFEERQIYRIDHYLGKETVQNLIALRFGNALFEPLWRREWVHDVQITVAEQVGVEGRAGFYDRTGALRDMTQNHVLQLLCIVAMEPPSSIEVDAVRDEKLPEFRGNLQAAPGGRLRTAADGRAARPAHAVHAPRRALRRLAVDRAHPRRLGQRCRRPPALSRRHLGPGGVQRAARPRGVELA